MRWLILSFLMLVTNFCIGQNYKRKGAFIIAVDTVINGQILQIKMKKYNQTKSLVCVTLGEKSDSIKVFVGDVIDSSLNSYDELHSLLSIDVISSRTSYSKSIVVTDNKIVFSLPWEDGYSFLFITSINRNKVTIHKNILVSDNGFVLFPKDKLIGICRLHGPSACKTELFKYNPSGIISYTGIFLNAVLNDCDFTLSKFVSEYNRQKYKSHNKYSMNRKHYNNIFIVTDSSETQIGK